MFISIIFSINKNIIQIYDNKNVKLFCLNLIDIALKYSWCICQSKKYYLVFKLTIISPKDHFLFIDYLNFHQIRSIDYINLSKISILI